MGLPSRPSPALPWQSLLPVMLLLLLLLLPPP